VVPPPARSVPMNLLIGILVGILLDYVYHRFAA
jgi:hypothetical protein